MAKTRSCRKSIAEARDDFARLVHQAEEGLPVEITRRGKTVAVLVSAAEHDRLKSGRRSPWEVIRDFRDCVVREGIELDDSDFEGLRDATPGRDIELS